MSEEIKAEMTAEERIVADDMSKMRSEAWEIPTMRALARIRKEEKRRRFYGIMNLAGCAAAAVLILVGLIPAQLPMAVNETTVRVSATAKTSAVSRANFTPTDEAANAEIGEENALAAHGETDNLSVQNETGSLPAPEETKERSLYSAPAARSITLKSEAEGGTEKVKIGLIIGGGLLMTLSLVGFIVSRNRRITGGK